MDNINIEQYAGTMASDNSVDIARRLLGRVKAGEPPHAAEAAEAVGGVASPGAPLTLEGIERTFQTLFSRNPAAKDDGDRRTPPALAAHADRLVRQQTLSGTGGGGDIKSFVSGIQACGYAPAGADSNGRESDPFTKDFRDSLPEDSRLFHPAQFDVEALRRDFPILSRTVHGRRLVWFDNAATTQKPRSVIDAVSRFQAEENSNIHRGAHTLAARATEAYEKARGKVRDYINASQSEEILFVRGTTEGINLVAQSYGRAFIGEGDEIVLTELEHHANIVPWQMLAKEKGAILRHAPINDRGEVMLDEYERLLGPRTRLVAITQASNSLGTILPVREMTRLAQRRGAVVLVDGAQSVAHLPVDVQDIGCDFFVFSGHKIFAPTGIGAVYGRRELLEAMPPWQGGGNMIRTVTFEETTYNDVPAKFEAGTPNVVAAVGLGAALDYVRSVGLDRIASHERLILEYATEQLRGVEGVRIWGPAPEKVGVISFTHTSKTPEEVAKLLDAEGIAVRAGHHCAQPSLRHFGLDATVRPSFSLYNTKEEVDRMVSVLRRVGKGAGIR